MKNRRNFFDIILFTEIFQGLLITIKHFFSKPVTEMYPYKKPRIYPRFRGVHYMKTNWVHDTILSSDVDSIKPHYLFS